MAKVVIRPRKDGGFSECSSPDELVGKGRCCHILDSNQPVMELNRIARGSYEVKIGDDTLTVAGQKSSIIEFFNSLPKLDQEKINKIVDYLNNED